MIRFLIATHGRLAEGFRDTIQIILGEEAARTVTALSLFGDDVPENDTKSLIERFFSELSEKDQAVVFSDIMYGSVNQMLMPYADDRRIFLLSGVNFPLLCEIVSAVVYTGAKVHPEMLREMVKKGREELVFVNDELKKKETEESFFD